MNFIEQMNSLRKSLTPLVSQFSIPQIRSLIIRKKLARNEYSYLRINPDPVITEVTPSETSFVNVNGVKLLTKRYSVKGVSASYKKDELVGAGIDYVIDGELRLESIMGGVHCEFVSMQINTLTFDLELLQQIGEQSLY